jgi:hypothetical protein
MVLAVALALSSAVPERPAGDPFDLSYVPADSLTRLVGVRPAALLAALPVPAGELDAKLASVVAQMLSQVGGDPAGGGLPPLRDITQVLTAGLRLSLPAVGRKGEFAMVNSWYVIRTADPFDWAGLAAGWFPAGEVREHAGRRYRRAYVRPALDLDARAKLGDAELAVHLWPADSRTLLFAFDEADVKRAIDRERTGGRVATPPLWDAVERCPLALAADTTADRDWLTVPDELPADRPALVPFAALLRSAGAVALGAEPRGDGVRLTAAVSAADLDGLTAKLRAAAGRVTAGAAVRADGNRATATVRVPLQQVLAALAGGVDD